MTALQVLRIHHPYQYRVKFLVLAQHLLAPLNSRVHWRSPPVNQLIPTNAILAAVESYDTRIFGYLANHAPLAVKFANTFVVRFGRQLRLSVYQRST